MNYIRLATIVLACAVLLSSHAYAKDVRAGRPAVNSRISAKAKEWFYRFQSGHIDRSQLDSAVNRELTDEMVKSEAARLRGLGRPVAFVYVGSGRVQKAIGYYFGVLFNGSERIMEAIAFDPDGRIAGIDFQILAPSE